MASGFQIKILKQNEKHEHHLLIDTQVLLQECKESSDSLNYNFMMTLQLYDLKTLQMMPIGQTLS